MCINNFYVLSDETLNISLQNFDDVVDKSGSTFFPFNLIVIPISSVQCAVCSELLFFIFLNSPGLLSTGYTECSSIQEPENPPAPSEWYVLEYKTSCYAPDFQVIMHLLTMLLT